METRTETTVIEVPPEKKAGAVRRQQEFGWLLVSAQETTTMRGDQVQRLVKLLFTRTGSQRWSEDMKTLEEELRNHDKSVDIGDDGLVLIGSPPRKSPPIPVLITIAFVGYLIGWSVADIGVAIAMGIVSMILSWFVMRQIGKNQLARHNARRRNATELFKKRRSEILVRVRAHVSARD